MKLSDRGLSLLKGFEGLRLRAYRDVGGVVTAGYGHVGDGLVEGQVYSPAQAERWLVEDVRWAELAVTDTQVELTQPQFDALVCLVFNIGAGAFRRSTLLRKLRLGAYRAAADQFLVWTKVNRRQVKGLVTRRFAERQLFLEGTK